MSSKPMLVLGMMSGTSLDGIDAVLVRISGGPPKISYSLQGHTHIPFAKTIREALLRVAEQSPQSPADFSQLNFRLGSVYAEAALAACRKFRIAPHKLNLIANHGQTIFHQGQPIPCLGTPTASTWQIGEASLIAAKTGITTVSDFRPADMALGGQGAPLVPYADYLLYRHTNFGRVSLNLGGIANVTVLPRNAKPSQVFAFDTGPANILVDALVSHFSRGRESFDRNAIRAISGRSISALLNELLRDPYLKLRPPKSTGREYYGRDYVKKLIALGRRYRATPNDLIRCTTLFTSLSVADALHRFVLPKIKIHQLIVSGGGAKNPLMLAQLAALLPDIEILSSSQLGVPEDAKEALAFALMAYETVHQRPSNLPSATGARGPAILGKISYAPPR